MSKQWMKPATSLWAYPWGSETNGRGEPAACRGLTGSTLIVEVVAVDSFVKFDEARQPTFRQRWWCDKMCCEDKNASWFTTQSLKCLHRWMLIDPEKEIWFPVGSYFLSRHQPVCMCLDVSSYGCSRGAVSRTKGDGKATCRRRAPQARGLPRMAMTWQKDTTNQGLYPLEVVCPKRCRQIKAPGRGETTAGGRTSQRGGPGSAMKYNVRLRKKCFASRI